MSFRVGKRRDIRRWRDIRIGIGGRWFLFLRNRINSCIQKYGRVGIVLRRRIIVFLGLGQNFSTRKESSRLCVL